ncbi:type II toxin-antitoxin system PemK/MazF family toxin [bacterium]|nr:type II toxin-antitoxin system PemK/MazF family toxin [bacterium]
MTEEIRRFDVYLVDLNPTLGSEIRKKRPCLIISPDEMNRHIRTVIIAPIVIAPMTSKGRNYPTRINCSFQKVKGQVVLDQIRTVDKLRLTQKLGSVSKKVQDLTLHTLAEMFAR